MLRQLSVAVPGLSATMAVWAGLSIDASELTQDVLVIAAHPG